MTLVWDITGVFSSEQTSDVITSQEAYITSEGRKRRDECVIADASQGVVIEEDQLQLDKISFGSIQISKIKLSITFQLQLSALGLDLSDPRQGFGLLNILKPFLSQLASVTDASIEFKELRMLEGSNSQSALVDSLYNLYFNQGLRQVYKILGSSNIIGNPVGFASKAGSAFEGLFSETYMGLQ
jgi:hypothetical protein